MVAVLAAVGVLFGPTAPASAHASLVSTTPKSDEVVQQLPGQVVLTFTEPVSPVAGRIKVLAPDGSAIQAEPRAEGNTLVIPLTGDGKQGTYVVSYRVLSADSHPIGGAYSFANGYFSADGGPSLDGAEPPAEGGFITYAFPVVRWLGWIGLILVTGAALVLSVLWPKRLARTGPTRLMWTGAGLIGGATVLELLLQIPYVAGGGLGDIGAAAVKDVLGSQFGLAHLVRLGLLAVAVVLLRPLARGRDWGSDQVLLLIVGTIALATWSVSGHPSASPAPVVTVTADVIHLGSMSVWVGGLVMLCVFLIPRATAAELAVITPVWSRYATYAVSALLLTGVAQALVELGDLGNVFTTKYGWLLVAKAGLFGAGLGMAFFARRLVGPVSLADESAAPRLRRMVIVEASIAAAVIGVASVLVQTTPARTPDAPPVEQVTDDFQTLTMKSNLFDLRADFEPGVSNIYYLHLYAFTPDGQPAKIEEWRVKAEPADGSTEAVEPSIYVLSPDHATGQVTLPVKGVWKFSYTLRTTDIDQATVTGDFTIR